MKTTTAMTMPAIAPPERVVWMLFMGAIAGSGGVGSQRET